MVNTIDFFVTRTLFQLLSLIIALSAMGNCFTSLFTHGRVVQELGREGVLPWSSFFASNKPFNTPMPGLFEQWVISTLYIIASPPGDVYLFISNCESSNI
jgi:amino acid transporter